MRVSPVVGSDRNKAPPGCGDYAASRDCDARSIFKSTVSGPDRSI